MAKQDDDGAQVSFTLLVDQSKMRTVKAIARDEYKTRGAVVREALDYWLEHRKKRRTA